MLSDEDEKELLNIEDDPNYKVFGNSEPKTLSTASKAGLALKCVET